MIFFKLLIINRYHWTVWLIYIKMYIDFNNYLNVIGHISLIGPNQCLI